MPPYALITGASSGLGLALAEALARQGRSLILVARQRDPLQAIASELTLRFGVEVLFRACDLGEPLRLSGFLLELEEQQTRIDLLVNCAGLHSRGHYLAQDWGQALDLLELNVIALARLCHTLGNSMAVQGGGQILNVAAMAGFHSVGWQNHYAASKAFVLHFSEGLREELRQTGIQVSVLCPGTLRRADETALYTVRALARNRALIIPAAADRWWLRAQRLLPRALLRRLAARAGRRHALH